MTTIYIKDNLKVEIDEYNHTLLKFVPGKPYKDKDTGENKASVDRWNALDYYPNLEQVLHDLVYRFKEYGEVSGVEQYMDAVATEIKQLAKHLRKEHGL